MDEKIKTLPELIKETAKALCNGNVDAEKEFIDYVGDLVKARENLFIHQHHQLPRGYKFISGDLVYNMRSKEFGFIVGPIDPWSTAPEDPTQSKGKRYAMVTIPNSHPLFSKAYREIEGEEPGAVVSSGYFSLRYPKQSDLKLFIAEESDPLLGNVKNDIELFCREQCIMECSDICFFHKYGKYPKS